MSEGTGQRGKPRGGRVGIGAIGGAGGPGRNGEVGELEWKYQGQIDYQAIRRLWRPEGPKYGRGMQPPPQNFNGTRQHQPTLELLIEETDIVKRKQEAL